MDSFEASDNRKKEALAKAEELMVTIRKGWRARLRWRWWPRSSADRASS
jgi:hypothetical protein